MLELLASLIAAVAIWTQPVQPPADFTYCIFGPTSHAVTSPDFIGRECAASEGEYYYAGAILVDGAPLLVTGP